MQNVAYSPAVCKLWAPDDGEKPTEARQRFLELAGGRRQPGGLFNLVALMLINFNFLTTTVNLIKV
jgi:hypothetical protein